MKITNRNQLPLVLVETLENDRYDSGRPEHCEHYVTITQLIRPAQLNYLSRQYADQLEYDVSDLVWSMLGSGFHATRERLSHSSKVLCEERLYGQFGNWTVSSRIDVYDPRCETLYDYKVVRCYSIQEGLRSEWYWQLQTGGLLLRRAVFATRELAIIAILKDWSATRAKVERDYPECGVQVLRTEPLANGEVSFWIESRLQQLEMDPPPPCSDEERWVRPGSWAVMKLKQKRAKKLFNTKEEAWDWIGQQDDWKQLFVQERPKEYACCETYCPVAKWCPQLAAEAKVAAVAEEIPF